MKKETSERYLQMMNQWIILKQNGKGIDSYLNKNRYLRVVVYGMGLYGRHVIRDLRNTGIEVMYCLDLQKVDSYENLEIHSNWKELEIPDAIINSVIQEHESIVRSLNNHYTCPIISLEDIVFESNCVE